MPEQSPSVLEDSATHENIHIHEHEEHASEAIDLGHNNHHVLLHHPQKDGHTWTPLPTLDRVNCHRVFEKPRQVVSKDDAVKRSSGIRRVSKFGLSPLGLPGLHPMSPETLEANGVEPLPEIPAGAASPPPSRASPTPDRQHSASHDKRRRASFLDDAGGSLITEPASLADAAANPPPLARRTSFLSPPTDTDFATAGNWTPRRQSSINGEALQVSRANAAADKTNAIRAENARKESKESTAEANSAADADAYVPPAPTSYPPPLQSQDSQSYRDRTNSARVQALGSMPTSYGVYHHDQHLSRDPLASTPLPPRSHNKRWTKIGKTQVQTSSGRLLEIQGTGLAKRNTKVRKGFKQTAMNAVLAVKMIQTDTIKVDIGKYANFIPKIIRRDIACGGNRFTTRALSKKSSYSHFDAAVLFVDISGFTALTESLNKKGTHGAELLCTHINAIYTKMMDELKRWGGDCVKFSGDALLILFEVFNEERIREIDEQVLNPINADGTAKAAEDMPDIEAIFSGLPLTLKEAAIRATCCATVLHEVIATHPEVNGVKLSLHAGVGCGRAVAHVIGGVLGRWELILTGTGIDQIKIGEPAAGPKETVVSPEVWEHCKEVFEKDSTVLTGDFVYKGFVRVEPLGQLSCEGYHKLAPTIVQSIMLRPRHIVFMPTYLPNAVIMNLNAGVCDSTSQAEMRDLTTMFVSLPNLDLSDNIECQSAIVAIQEATYQLEGSVNKVVVDDKGALVLIVFGLPPVVHSDDPKRALAAAFLMRHHLHDLGLRCQIGVASSRVFCGIVGAETRKEYTVMGDGVNLSARLMANAKEYEILCDQATYEESKDEIRFKTKAPVKLKGKADLYDVYRPTAFLPPPDCTVEVIGKVGDMQDLESMVEILAHDMSNIIIITGKPGMGKHSISQYLDKYCKKNGLKCLRSGRGENMYLEGEVQAKTLFTAWRKVFMEALGILFSERTGEPMPPIRTSSTSDFVAKCPFDTVNELRHFMDDVDPDVTNLLKLMYPEMDFQGCGKNEGKSQWFHINEDANDDGNKNPSPGKFRGVSVDITEENGSDVFVLDPKAHANIHKQEKKLKKLLHKFFTKFCTHHPSVLTFENTYGMSSSKLAPSSWTLFHDLFKDFEAVRDGVIEEMAKAEEIDESRFDPHNHDLVPKFCIVTTTMPKSGVEYMEAVEAAREYGTLLEIGPMLDSDVTLMAKEYLHAHEYLDYKVLTFVSDMSEGNPSIIVELCKSIREADVCDFVDERCTMKAGRSLQECKLNTKLRHMALQEFGTLQLHEQLIAKMASVYTREFSTGMLQTHVLQHQRDHEDTFINLKKCANQLLKSDIFAIVRMPDWMKSADSSAESALIFRSKLMQKAVSELLLESHVTSVARSIKSASHARRISAFWLQKAVDHENDDGDNSGSGSSRFIEEYLLNVPARHRMSVDAQSMDLLGEGGDLGAVRVRGMSNLSNSSRGLGRMESDLLGMEEGDEEEEEEKKEDIVRVQEPGVNREGIIRNWGGEEEPSSKDPELWNVDGTEVDFNQMYKFGGQLWYVQSRVQEAAFKGTEINGQPMNGAARRRLGLEQTKGASMLDLLLKAEGGEGEGEKKGAKTLDTMGTSLQDLLIGEVDMEEMISPKKTEGGDEEKKM